MTGLAVFLERSRWNWRRRYLGMVLPRRSVGSWTLGDRGASGPMWGWPINERRRHDGRKEQLFQRVHEPTGQFNGKPKCVSQDMSDGQAEKANGWSMVHAVREHECANTIVGVGIA